MIQLKTLNKAPFGYTALSAIPAGLDHLCSHSGSFVMGKICGIYKITSPSKKIYIGQSVNIAGRISAYKNANCRVQRKLLNSINKYGWCKHKFEIICQCHDYELNELEKYYIELYQCFDSEYGLNLKTGGRSNTHLSDETKNKISSALNGHIVTKETREKLSSNHKGFKHTDEAIRKITESSIGRLHTDESKQKMSRIRSGMKLTIEHIIKIREVNKTKRKPFYATSPSGVEFYFDGLFDICKKHNVNKGNLTEALNGKRKTVNGWSNFKKVC